MSFTNVEIRPEELPRFDAVELQPVHADYPRLCVAIVLVAACLALVALALALVAIPPLRGFILGPKGLIVLPAVILLAGFTAWFAYRSAKMVGYAVREQRIDSMS